MVKLFAWGCAQPGKAQGQDRVDLEMMDVAQHAYRDRFPPLWRGAPFVELYFPAALSVWLSLALSRLSHACLCAAVCGCIGVYGAGQELAKTEQLLATRKLPSGEELSGKDLRKEVEERLSRSYISRENKLRLLLLYVVCQGGLKEKERVEVFTHAWLCF